MLPWYTAQFGNPSSIYRLGQDARSAIERSRIAVARALRCQPSEIIFTSGATESNNAALAGVAWTARRASHGAAPHLITTAIEHHAVLHPAEWLADLGFELTILPCDGEGIVDPDAVRAAIRPSTCLVSVMYVNNEVGAIQPIPEIARVTRDHGVPLHVDAVQAAGFLGIDVDALGADLLSLSGHKFYGPKGVGILYLRKGAPVAHLQLGGGQESGRRGGTENVPSIVGLGVAIEQAVAQRDAHALAAGLLRDQLWEGLQEHVGGLALNGPELDSGHRLPNNLNFAIDGIQGETVLLSLDMLGVAGSAGSACTTGNTQPSHVLTAMGHSVERARSSLRLTTGRCNTPGEIDEAIDAIATTVSRIRQLTAR
jgi:cysteine desulfurase